jgi:hypothetical protein
MDAHRFDDIVRRLAPVASRRGVLRGLVSGGLGLSLTRVPWLAAARKRKRRRTPLQRNAFGCVDVGKPCRGKDSVCCSGICEGKKPKPGKKDRSRCVAHDAQGCLAGQQQEACGGGADVPCTTASGQAGLCNITTGNAPYCAAGAALVPCTHDADCQTVCGPRAACILCPNSSVSPLCVGPANEAPCQV